MSLPDPRPDCPLCPRLKAFRDDWRAREPGWFNAPVPSFGDPDAELLVVGLAPGVRGANRTGRPFTGDFAGELLYSSLIEFGFATGRFDARIDDGLTLVGAAITNAVRCVPPENKPTPEEINTCRPWLIDTIKALPRLKAILALGKIAHDQTLRTLGFPMSRFKFVHGAIHTVADGLTLHDTYHSSRYNANTGRLTPAMFRDVFTGLAHRLGR
ncbi:MAG: uracil-DNA glycosylase [Hyphomicrobiaceae bacterium]|nr:uracil-DNA glycosylase [Hyphomicrobiaceae bacterium]